MTPAAACPRDLEKQISPGPPRCYCVLSWRETSWLAPLSGGPFHAWSASLQAWLSGTSVGAHLSVAELPGWVGSCGGRQGLLGSHYIGVRMGWDWEVDLICCPADLPHSTHHSQRPAEKVEVGGCLPGPSYSAEASAVSVSKCWEKASGPSDIHLGHTSGTATPQFLLCPQSVIRPLSHWIMRVGEETASRPAPSDGNIFLALS